MTDFGRLLAVLRPGRRRVRDHRRRRVDTIRRGLNFTLTTEAGDLDVLGEVPGGGTYEALVPRSEMRRLFGLDVRFVDLETLIHLKRAAGRPKDLERIAELEAIAEERRRDE